MAQVLSLASVAQDLTAKTETVGLPVAKILKLRAPNSTEIASFASALTAVECEDIFGNSRRKTTYLSNTALATVITATNA